MDELNQKQGVTEPAAAQEEILRTFRMEISFDGTGYHGWQLQNNGITVQEVIESKLFQLFGGRHQIRIQGSSRTDAGVHALGMVASFRAPESPYIPDWKLKKALNRLLPDEIRIRSAELTTPDFNARFSAKGKSYVYVINTGDINPFTNRYSWYLNDCTDVEAMKKGIACFQGTHDFTTFTVERGAIDDPVRTIMRTEIKTFGPLICLYFLGTGFLYKMVRSMVGSLIFVGRGRMTPEELRGRLEARSRAFCKDTAPARGLFLKKVFYEEGAWENDSVEVPPFWIY